VKRATRAWESAACGHAFVDRIEHRCPLTGQVPGLAAAAGRRVGRPARRAPRPRQRAPGVPAVRGVHARTRATRP